MIVDGPSDSVSQQLWLKCRWRMKYLAVDLLVKSQKSSSLWWLRAEWSEAEWSSEVGMVFGKELKSHCSVSCSNRSVTFCIWCDFICCWHQTIWVPYLSSSCLLWLWFVFFIYIYCCTLNKLHSLANEIYGIYSEDLRVLRSILAMLRKLLSWALRPSKSLRFHGLWI